MSIQDFLEQVFKDDQGKLCAAFGYKRNKVTNKFEKWKEFSFDLTPEGRSAFVKACDTAASKGWDCFFAPAIFTAGKRTKENISHSNVLWADFDSGNGLPEFEVAPTVVVSSSFGKYHTYWNLDTPVERDQLESFNRQLAYAFDADKSGWDSVQLLRVPGTFNYKYDKRQDVVLLGIEPMVYDQSMFTGFLMGSLQRKYPSKALNNLRVWI